MLQYRSHSPACLHLRQHPPPASTPRSGEHVEVEPPLQLPCPILSRRPLLHPLLPGRCLTPLSPPLLGGMATRTGRTRRFSGPMSRRASITSRATPELSSAAAASMRRVPSCSSTASRRASAPEGRLPSHASRLPQRLGGAGEGGRPRMRRSWFTPEPRMKSGAKGSSDDVPEKGRQHEPAAQGHVRNRLSLEVAVGDGEAARLEYWGLGGSTRHPASAKGLGLAEKPLPPPFGRRLAPEARKARSSPLLRSSPFHSQVYSLL